MLTKMLTNEIAIVKWRKKQVIHSRMNWRQSRVFSTVTMIWYTPATIHLATNTFNSTSHSFERFDFEFEYVFRHNWVSLYDVAVLLIFTNQYQCETIDHHFSHHMAMALEEFTGSHRDFWYSREISVSSLVKGLFSIHCHQSSSNITHSGFSRSRDLLVASLVRGLFSIEIQQLFNDLK